MISRRRDDLKGPGEGHQARGTAVPRVFDRPLAPRRARSPSEGRRGRSRARRGEARAGWIHPKSVPSRPCSIADGWLVPCWACPASDLRHLGRSRRRGPWQFSRSRRCRCAAPTSRLASGSGHLRRHRVGAGGRDQDERARHFHRRRCSRRPVRPVPSPRRQCAGGVRREDVAAPPAA
jgi:hypothetical protein